MASKPTLVPEAYAIEKHLGIWSYRKSLKHYLLRLREGGKTVYYIRSPYLVAKIQNAEVIDLSKYNGLFVRVRDKINKIQLLRKEAQLKFQKHKRMKNGLPVIIFENQQYWLVLQKISKCDLLQIEGFAKLSTKKAVAN